MSASSTTGVEASDDEAATVWLVWRGNRFETSSDGVEGVYLSAEERNAKVSQVRRAKRMWYG